MAFSLLEAHELQSDLCHAVLDHEGQHLTVMLKCGREKAAALPNPFTAEIDHASVVRFEANLLADDASSGLFASGDPAVILADGTVHNQVEIGADHVLVDVYVQRGPEFFTVTSEELDGTIPEMGSRLRVWLRGVSVWPANL